MDLCYINNRVFIFYRLGLPSRRRSAWLPPAAAAAKSFRLSRWEQHFAQDVLAAAAVGNDDDGADE